MCVVYEIEDFTKVVCGMWGGGGYTEIFTAFVCHNVE